MRWTAAAVTTLALGLACSGLPTSGDGYDNVGACLGFVEAYNALDCIPEPLKPEDRCPESLAMSPCDLSDHYECMAEAARCSEGSPDLGGQARCGAPTCN